MGQTDPPPAERPRGQAQGPGPASRGRQSRGGIPTRTGRLAHSGSAAVLFPIPLARGQSSIGHTGQSRVCRAVGAGRMDAESDSDRAPPGGTGPRRSLSRGWPAEDGPAGPAEAGPAGPGSGEGHDGLHVAHVLPHRLVVLRGRTRQEGVAAGGARGQHAHTLCLRACVCARAHACVMRGRGGGAEEGGKGGEGRKGGVMLWGRMDEGCGSLAQRRRPRGRETDRAHGPGVRRVIAGGGGGRSIHLCVCVCVCACVRACAYVCARVRVMAGSGPMGGKWAKKGVSKGGREEASARAARRTRGGGLAASTGGAPPPPPPSRACGARGRWVGDAPGGPGAGPPPRSPAAP